MRDVHTPERMDSTAPSSSNERAAKDSQQFRHGCAARVRRLERRAVPQKHISCAGARLQPRQGAGAPCAWAGRGEDAHHHSDGGARDAQQSQDARGARGWGAGRRTAPQQHVSRAGGGAALSRLGSGSAHDGGGADGPQTHISTRAEKRAEHRIVRKVEVHVTGGRGPAQPHRSATTVRMGPHSWTRV